MPAVERTTDVLIVGAGPTGLMLANWLAKLGVDAILVDGKSGPTRESRALGVQARTMEIYDQLGVADQVLDEAYIAQGVAPGYQDKAFGFVRFANIGSGVSPYPHLYILEQSRNEKLLYSNLQRLSGAVLWQHRLQDLDQETADDGGSRVTVTLQGPDGEVTIRSRYCVGTDGPSSVVRKLRGIDFEGRTNEHTFFVADAAGVEGLVPTSINLRFGRKFFLLTFPMGSDGHNRLLGVVPHGSDDPADDVAESSIRPMLQRVFGVTYASTSWFSTYRLHHRVAAQFTDGPVLLAGDAGHVHSPVGAQGMNTGLQDSHNLAFKLGAVLKGEAPPSYLQRYEAERRPVALRLTNTTDRLFAAVTSNNPVLRAVRRFLPRIAAPVLLRIIPRLSGSSRMFEYLAQVRIHYWMDESARERAQGQRDRIVGRRLPWTGQNFESLKAAAWMAHVYGEVAEDRLRSLRDELDVDVRQFPAAPANGLTGGKVLLVRPDGFVAAAAYPDQAAAEFAAALQRHIGN
ncbi:FAD-dependent monooxygenase [Arthrobacter castelli]|uniref:FAD-dependent monooxygenase n=1 Tax=Arthrobacter castelli TaxID=271431 RepID=UPI0004037BBA|nr:FAD-dependent monooxygenase [Arthrobacter castelli]